AAATPGAAGHRAAGAVSAGRLVEVGALVDAGDGRTLVLQHLVLGHAGALGRRSVAGAASGLKGAGRVLGTVLRREQAAKAPVAAGGRQKGDDSEGGKDQNSATRAHRALPLPQSPA